MQDNTFNEYFTTNLDKCTMNYDNILVIGDLNFNMLNETKCKTLNDLCDVFNLSQLVSKPTCYMKGYAPSLVDVILTNVKNQCFNVHNIPTGISDCHNLLSVTLKGKVIIERQHKISYRSYKNFDAESFNSAITKLSIIPSNNVKTSEDINAVYEKYEKDFINILDIHAPIKSRQPRKQPLPCMNRELRKAVYRKHMLYTQYTKNRNSKTWEKYRRQRNMVTKLKKKSVKTYFLERCSGGSKNSNFWSTMKPFFSKKCNLGEQKIILTENNNIINDTKEVSEHFNNFFATVANKIGNDVIYDPVNHPSILQIKGQNFDKSFDFQKTTSEKVGKIMNNINVNKATGVDGIPAKVVKHCKNSIVPQITSLINLSVETGCFPDRLKQAQVRPLHKKNSPLDKSNYRPVSILPIFSKIYEKILETQLGDFLEKNISLLSLCF